MITKEQALEIAKKKVPEIEKFMSNISLEKPKSSGYGEPPSNCWYITYSQYNNPNSITFISSEVIAVDCETGEVLFNRNLSDEG